MSPRDLTGGLSHAAIVRALVEAAGVGMVISCAGEIVFANEAFARATQFTVDELVGKDLASLAHGKSRGQLDMQLRRHFDGSRLEQRVEILLEAKDGRILRTEHVSAPIEQDRDLFVVSTFVERMDRHDARGAPAAIDERSRQLFDEDVTGRLIATPDWRIVDCNSAMAQMIGCEHASQVVGRSLSEFTQDAMLLQRLVAGLRADGKTGATEVQLDRLDGESIRVTCSVVGGFDEAGRLLSMRGQLIEVTESRRLQMRLLGTQRMEGIGRLAGGVAHDFNNLLMVISGHSERLFDKLAPEDPLRASAEAIQQASARAASLTRQLLAFGRRQVFELRAVAVHRLVRDAQALLAKMVGPRIALRLEVPSELPDIRADATQLEHVIINLALNAREAMEAGGTLTIRVDTTEVERAPRTRSWVRPGRYVRVVVADTGPGMDPVTKAHVFEPFFTTKQVGSGTGLGLATVYGIVKQSNGFVWVDSEVGHGAAFTLLFPAVPSEGFGSHSERRAAGAEAILVVERDERVRTFVSDALRRRGYQVLDAPSSQQALEVFAAHRSRVHLLVCEVTSAVEDAPLYARLKALDPTIQVLFMIDPAGGQTPTGTALPGMPAIQKPFTLRALGDAVRDVLDSGEGRG